MSYKENVKLWKKAYQEILSVCDKYQGFDDKYDFNDIDDMRRSAKNHLLLIEWYEKYGLKIPHYSKPYSQQYFSVNSYSAFNYYKDAQQDKDNCRGKYISWSDDNKQPKDEWLFEISFPTGAYIFGEDYKGQQELFQDFITELKSYKPNYSDTVNHHFYWKLENAKHIYDEFDKVLQKYRERNKSELDERKAERLRKELAELEAGK